jgi:hypothetical protein
MLARISKVSQIHLRNPTHFLRVAGAQHGDFGADTRGYATRFARSMRRGNFPTLLRKEYRLSLMRVFRIHMILYAYRSFRWSVTWYNSSRNLQSQNLYCYRHV